MNIHTDVTLFRYLHKILESLNFIDIVPATIKTFFFGFFIGMIGCYNSFTDANGTESVGRAANSAVVAASLAIFIIDMIAVQLTDLYANLCIRKNQIPLLKHPPPKKKYKCQRALYVFWRK